MKVTFAIPGLTDCSLEATDGGLYEIDFCSTRKCGRGERITITTNEETAVKMRDDALTRAIPGMLGQPPQYATACMRAAESIEAALVIARSSSA